MALNNHGITHVEGFVCRTAEDTICNLSRIGDIGMSLANDRMLNIMVEKSSSLTNYEDSMDKDTSPEHSKPDEGGKKCL
jgi:hypothetical protein